MIATPMRARPTAPLAPAALLPRWPFALPFVGYPLAWLLGVGDLVFVAAAIIMIVLMARQRTRIELPRRFGIWIGFIALMLCSVAAIDSGGRLIGFAYRAALYLAVTVLAVYLHAARSAMSARFVEGTLTAFWLVVVAGGFLGVFFPLLEITTPLGALLPHAVTQNELVHEMVYRRTTQFDPTAWTAVAPRPSAPFLYTNGWGMAYALLVPIVISYARRVRRTRRFVPLLILLGLSLIPALATLNRGMIVGLVVAAVFVCLRLALAARLRVGVIVAACAVIAAIVFPSLPSTQLLSERLDSGNSTEVRSELYLETWQRTLDSPIIGFGAPRPSETDGAPSAGTQGQLWMVLFSHGIPATVLFVGFFVAALLRSLRRRDGNALTHGTVLITFLVEIVFYGALATGLAIAMTSAIVALTPPGRAVSTLPVPRARVHARPLIGAAR